MIKNFGKYILMLYYIFHKPEKFGVYFKRLSHEVIELGVKSLFIVSIMSAFMGAVLVIQTATAIESAWIPDYTVGFTVKQSMLLEFCPTIISLILAGKVGSSIASELGSMKVTEQIDALEVMGVNSIGYLIGPKILGSLFIFPIVITYSMFFGFMGGGLVCYFTEIIPVNQYILGIRSFSEDNFTFIRYALTKTVVFAFLITSISSYFGYYLKGGSLAVGKASTNAVVYSSIFILFANYILTQLMLI
ncbi:MAG: ABC transporter permease [Flavobacteriales bacterium]|jgi:phospholipid/cholesterol/gamma-HCH transport system permease protein|nr:ABC transporter permease [Flavobacteriales bacterium]MDC3389643.1 ABC transporter permease [Flavobacteriales bacterium]MDG1239112.1 ABC transporter permease [Flavobacteriales bacterium]MDG1440204.1 ABC transporter permease [Flavobacteriales bacterium]